MWEEANVMGDRLTLDQMLKSPEIFYGERFCLSRRRLLLVLSAQCWGLPASVTLAPACS